MERVIIVAAIISTFIFTSASARMVIIPGDYPTIQEGIDSCTDGDTVLVQPGTYVENINFNGHNIVLGSMFLTTGDTTYIAETVIDGGSSGPVITFESGEDSTSIIIGFTIINGFTDYGDNPILGGGIYCRNSSPIIRNNRIIENQACWGGGIAYCDGDPIIHDNYIAFNIADI